MSNSMSLNIVYADYLSHHGIMGMKWGKRNGPPYPLRPEAHSKSEQDAGWRKSLSNKRDSREPKDSVSKPVRFGSVDDKNGIVDIKMKDSDFGDPTVLNKGVQLNSVSAIFVDPKKYQSTGRWMYLYDPTDEWDSKVYKGPFATYLAYDGAKFVREHKYEVVKDLKMPSKQQRIDEFKKLPKKDLIKDLGYIKNYILDHGGFPEETVARLKRCDLKNLKTDDDWDTAYELFGHAMEASWKYRSTQKYCKVMSKKWDAMIDDNNQKIYNDAHNPIIIFNAMKALKAIEQEPAEGFLTWEEIKANTDEIRDELSKVGKKVKL